MTAPAAYAFSRINFVGRRNGLKTLLILQMFPTFMAMPAIYGLLAKFNLLDNLLHSFWYWQVVLLSTSGFERQHGPDTVRD